MHSLNFVSLLLLSSTALGAPTRQHPLVHDRSPYNKDHNDPYDRKFDSYGEGVQPLPMVSIITLLDRTHFRLVPTTTIWQIHWIYA